MVGVNGVVGQRSLASDYILYNPAFDLFCYSAKLDARREFRSKNFAVSSVTVSVML